MRCASRVIAAALILAACTPSRDLPDAGVSPTGGASPPDPSSTIALSLDDRDFAARSDRPVCRRSAGRRATWAVEYSVDRERGLTSVQILVPNAPRETRTDTFVAIVSFGPLLDPVQRHVIEGRPENPPAGRGTVTVTRRGPGARVSVRGTTADGVRMRVDVRCGAVEEGAA